MGRGCYNLIMFLKILAQTAEDQCSLNRDDPVIVGVSGGADSLVLMHGLNALGFNLVIAHLDHGLREESDQDTQYVADLAAKLSLPFVTERIDVQSIAAQSSRSIEEAAREVRYQFLFSQAVKHQAQAVAVGHHADDQVETVLMHFLRGAALPGLSGMAYRRVMSAWDDSIPLVRPLLSLWREDIDSYLGQTGLDPRIDLTNQDTTYFRNRLRHDLIPELESYNPTIRQVLWRMSDVLRSEDKFLDDLTNQAWGRIFISEAQDRVELDRQKFLDCRKAIQRRVLRRAVSLLRPDLRDVGFDAVERGLAFIQNPSGRGEMDLAARLNLVIIGQTLIVKTWTADLPDWGNALLPDDGTCLPLEPGHSVALRNGWRLEADLLAQKPADVVDQVKALNAEIAWLDIDKMEMPLIVRGRREGEVWKPLGMGGHTQALSDFFINQKVPEHLRDVWPLVCSGGQIAWICGLRPSEVFKISANTQHILRLRLVQHAD